MKKFEMPEIKVMTVSVNERIAASGTALPEGAIGGLSGVTVYVDASNRIIGTDVKHSKGQINKNRDMLTGLGCLR